MSVPTGEEPCVDCGHDLLSHQAQEGMCLQCPCAGWRDVAARIRDLETRLAASQHPSNANCQAGPGGCHADALESMVTALKGRLAASEAGAAAMRSILGVLAFFELPDKAREPIEAALASDAGRNYRNAILEDVAKVAESTISTGTRLAIAAAIRALKEGT